MSSFNRFSTYSAIWLLSYLAIGLLPAFSAPPAWWTTQNVLDTTKTANDYAAVNQGQLKAIAKKGITEMNAKLPGGAGTELNDLLTTWSAVNASRNDYTAVNVGQVKALAKKFYDRLNAVGVITPYPWTAATTDDKDYAAANIGQVKAAFSFAIPLSVIPPPALLTATAGSAKVTLTWSAVTAATSYKLQRATVAGGPYADFTGNTVNAPTVTLINTGLTNNTTYYYVAYAVNASGTSLKSNEASAKPVAVPAAPTVVTATAGNTQVTLTWVASANATSYKVQRGTVTGGPYANFTGNTVNAPTVTLINTGLTNNTTYYYVVFAVNGSGTSVKSAQAIATPVAPPAAPTGLTATAGNTQVTLNWTAVSGATSYKVQRATVSGGPYVDFAANTSTTPTLTNTGLTNGTIYYYVVFAVNGTVSSAQSSPVSATPTGSTTVDTPTISMVDAVYPFPVKAVASDTTVGATIRYTTDGTDPTESSKSVISGGSLYVTRTMTLKLKAFKTGSTSSAVKTSSFTVSYPGMGVGSRQSLVVQTDGSLKTWGDNRFGTLGQGNQTTPVTPLKLTGTYLDVKVGSRHTLALKEDGTVWVWGANDFGQLGLGHRIDQLTPVKIPSLSQVVEIAVGVDHSLARTQTGNVYAWGSNESGQAAVLTGDEILTPTQIVSLSSVVSLAAGFDYSLAVKNDGTLWSWGANDHGQLGSGNQIARTTPASVSGITTARKAIAGAKHAFVILNDNSVKGWGDNTAGQLGLVNRQKQLSPLAIASMNGTTLGAAGWDHTLMVDTSKTLRSWGSGRTGLRGNNTTVTSSTAAQVMTDVVALGSGWDHAFAVKTDGSFWTWGSNEFNQLGASGANALIPFNRGFVDE